jgi:hypothetical protein
MQGLDHTRPLTNAMKWMLLAASILVFLAGIQLFILTENTDRYFAWTVDPPLTAAALGGAYWASSVLELGASRQPTWARARIALPAVLVFTTLTFVTTLLHLDRFHLGNGFPATTQFVTWLWIAVYAVVPVLMSILLVHQLRAAGVDEPRRNPLPPWLRAVLGVHAVVLEFVALIRYPSSVDWARPAAAIYVLFLASVLLVGIYGWVTTRRIAHRSIGGLGERRT